MYYCDCQCLQKQPNHGLLWNNVDKIIHNRLFFCLAMNESWRWFGPDDPVSLDQVKQAGASGVVTALHHLPPGEVWPLEQVLDRKAEVNAANLTWSVAESIPIHNSIKLRSGPYRRYIAAWQDSLRAVARAGVKVICYNFMPVLEWTRTDLKWRMPSTGYALRYDADDLAAYDLFILRRKNAELDYTADQRSAVQLRFEVMSEKQAASLEHTILAGLPGTEFSYTRQAFRDCLAEYIDLKSEDLRANLIAFLAEVIPVAEEMQVRLAVHPDDPPWPIFGLPRVVSTAEDVRAILASRDTVANGLTFCVGSFGARPDNDLLGMVNEFADRIHFAHLRQVTREADGAFHEAGHLEGSSDMVGVIHSLLQEERRRLREGRPDHEIPMRPDHGHLLAGDINAPLGNPGYSLVGRLKGLAELRGVIHGLKYLGSE
jgi:mannonate dehydratase